MKKVFNRVLAFVYSLVAVMLLTIGVPYRLQGGHELRALYEVALAALLFWFAWMRWEASR